MALFKMSTSLISPPKGKTEHNIWGRRTILTARRKYLRGPVEQHSRQRAHSAGVAHNDASGGGQTSVISGDQDAWPLDCGPVKTIEGGKFHQKQIAGSEKSADTRFDQVSEAEGTRRKATEIIKWAFRENQVATTSQEAKAQADL